jgi:hypothetical protein
MATEKKAQTTLPNDSWKGMIDGTPFTSCYQEKFNLMKNSENYFEGNEIEYSFPSYAPNSTATFFIPNSIRFLKSIFVIFELSYDDTGFLYINTFKKMPWFLAYALVNQIKWKIGNCETQTIQAYNMLMSTIDKLENQEQIQHYAKCTGLIPATNFVSIESSTHRLLHDISEIGDEETNIFTNVIPAGTGSGGTVVKKFNVIFHIPLPYSSLNVNKNNFPLPLHLTNSNTELNILLANYDKTIFNVTGAKIHVVYGNVFPDNQLKNVVHHHCFLQNTDYVDKLNRITTGEFYSDVTTGKIADSPTRTLQMKFFKTGETMEIDFWVQRTTTFNENVEVEVNPNNFSSNSKSFNNGNLIVTDIKLSFFGQSIYVENSKLHDVLQLQYNKRDDCVKMPEVITFMNKQGADPSSLNDEATPTSLPALQIIKNGVDMSIAGEYLNLKTFSDQNLFKYYKIPIAHKTSSTQNEGDYCNGCDFKNTTVELSFKVWSKAQDQEGVWVEPSEFSTSVSSLCYAGKYEKIADAQKNKQFYKDCYVPYTGELFVFIQQKVYSILQFDGNKAVLVQ